MRPLIGLFLIGICWCVSVQTASAVTPVGFTRTDFTIGTTPIAVAIGDLNRDGKPDLAVADVNAYTVSVLLGDGAGSFGAPINYATAGRPYCVAIGDLNGDGKPDLAVAGELYPGAVSVLIGNGDGTFAPRTDFETGHNTHWVAIGDINRDGKPDLAVAHNYTGAVSVLLGDGAGGFGPHTDFAVGSGSITLEIADLNGDANLDLAVSNNSSNSVSVLLGDGMGGFARTDFPTGPNPYGPAIGDLNGDGKLDLAVSNYWANTVSVLLGDGTGSFGAPTSFPAASLPIAVVIGDLNDDGKPDLATSSGDTGDGVSAVSVLLGDGTGSFGAPAEFAVGFYPLGMAIGELNRDGKLDLVTTGHIDNDVSVLLNNVVCGVLEVTDSPPSDQLALSAYPNPTTGQTSVSFQLPKAGPVTLGIYDVLGRRLRTWELSSVSAGQHQLEWDGLAEDGHRVPPGVLFYRLSAAGRTLKEKVIRMQ